MIKSNFWRKAGAVWGMGGTIFFLIYACYRLWGYAWELQYNDLTIFQLYILILWTAYMLYTEGVKAFGRQFSPRVAARSQYLARQGNRLQIILAPLFVFGYFHTTRMRLIVTYSLTVFIIVLIVGIRFLPHPWRAIIDMGALLGIMYGTATVLWFAGRAWRSHPKYVADPLVEIRKK